MVSRCLTASTTVRAVDSAHAESSGLICVRPSGLPWTSRYLEGLTPQFAHHASEGIVGQSRMITVGPVGRRRLGSLDFLHPIGVPATK